MPKSSKEPIHENTTTIPTSTMSNSKNSHAGTFHNGGRKKPPWCNISLLYSLPKRGEDLYLCPHLSKYRNPSIMEGEEWLRLRSMKKYNSEH